MPRHRSPLLIPLIIATYAVSSCSAAVIADPAAPVTQQPTILRSTNGITQVNIQTPSAAGVSRNSYSRFDIDSTGVMLNNARTAASTQLGGWIDGNPWLSSGTAKIILNEINSADPSRLNGYIEVGGDRAQVVIANPAGITCGGCGFINTSRATLTTGTPILSDGTLQGYLVRQGSVTVAGNGMDASGTDYTDIIARAILINAEIWAKDLRITTGPNRVDPSNTAAVSVAGIGIAPAFSIDSSVLGGMYAGKITLIGTEAGLGVRNSGIAVTTSGAMLLSTQGALSNTGTIDSANDLTVRTSAEMTNSGVLYAQNNLALHSDTHLIQSGIAAAGSHTELSAPVITTAEESLSAAGLMPNGTLGSSGDLTIHATTQATLAGTLASAGQTRIQAASAHLPASRIATSSLSVLADNVNTSEASISAATASVTANDTVTLAHSTVQTGDLSLAAASVTTDSQITAARTATLTATAFDNTLGTITAGEQLTVATESLVHTGTLQSAGTLNLATISDTTLDGKITAQDHASVTVTGALTNQGSIQGGKLTLNAASLDNMMTGSIIGAESMRLRVQGTLHNSGLIDGGNVNLESTILTNDLYGSIFGNYLAIKTGTLTNGTLIGEYTLPVIAARNHMDIATNTLDNVISSTIMSMGDMAIGNTLDSSGHATGKATRITNAASIIDAGATLTLGADTLNNLNTGYADTIQQLSQSHITDVIHKSSEDYYIYDYFRTVSETQVASSTPALITSGTDMILHGTTMTNDKSRIIAGGDLTGDVANLTSINAIGVHLVHDEGTVTFSYLKGDWDGHHRKWSTTTYAPADIVTSITLPVTQTLAHTGAADTPPFVSPVNPLTTVTTPTTASLPMPLTASALYHTVTDPSIPYVIASDPRFTSYRQWISSSYMLAKLAADPASMQKRLGDGFYEQQLVRDQITQLSGRRFLAGYASDEAQYQALMDAGVIYAKTHNLVPGITLSAEQMAALTTDIVWLVSRQVTLPNGTVTTALVPQVYLIPRAGDLQPNGSLIAADGSIDLRLFDKLSNGATLSAGRDMTVYGADLVNTGTLRAGERLTLLTRNDLSILGGRLQAADITATAGEDLSIASTLRTTTGKNGSQAQTFDRQGSVAAAGSLTLYAGRDLALTAASLTNQQDGSTTLTANRDVTLATATTERTTNVVWDNANYRDEHTSTEHGTTIQATGDIALLAGNDISVRAASLTSGRGDITARAGNGLEITAGIGQTVFDQASRQKSWIGSSSDKDHTLKESIIASTLTGHSLLLAAGNDMTLQAADLQAQQNIQTDAGHDINILAAAYREANLHQASKNSFGGLIGSSSLESTDAVKLHEATVKTEAKNIIMNSGRDINVVASNVSAGDALVLASTGDTNIVSGQEISQSEHWSKKSGFFSGGGNIYSSEFDLKSNADITAKASTVDGKTVTINSGNDTHVKGSAIVGEKDVAINSGKNLIIEAANEQHTSEEKHETRGWGIYGSSGGLGFTIGQQDKKDALSSDAALQSQSRSLVGSINGDFSLNAGDSVAVKGSDLVAGNDMSIQAKNVTLQESEDATKTKETHEFRQSGLTVALTGSVASAAQTANQMNQASQKTDNDRLKALAAMTTGLSALSAYGDVAGSGTNAIGVSATIGNTQSKSESTSQSHVHSGSSATAGGDITIVATGDGANSDITVSGSDITAGKNITLKADDAITLTASQDTYSNRSSSSSSSGGIGMAATVGSGGGQLGFTANASMGRGRTNGDDALINNTHITANDTLTLTSGGDTTLKGATAKADTIKADVGGNLAIESLQDTSTYASKSQNVGGSVTVGWGGASGSVSYSQTDVKSDYASVNEQSGMQAGDGGFQINVAHNTDLKGGVISSSDKAVSENKNSLTTATLTTSDINNHATASADTSGFSIGTDAASGLYGAAKTVIGSAMMFADESGSSSGTTKSAIGAGTITITDETKQQELSGNTAQETIASISTDTANAHTAATKQDVQGMQERVEAQQAINRAIFKESVKFTDEAYRTMFLQKAKMYEVTKDQDGKPVLRELSNDEKNNLQKGSDGKVHITDNGIFNDPDAAAKYAAQHANADGALYAIHFPEAENGLSEMMVAGYQKYLESDLLGLTNATQETKTVMENYGTEGLHLDGHSRGSLTVANAMDSMGNDPNAKGSLSQTTINFFGPAQNVANADETLAYLQGRDSITDIDAKNSMVINYQAHMADPVARFVGWNVPTGGTIPPDSSVIEEMLRAGTGRQDTSHNLYFLNPVFFQPGSNPETRLQLIDNFWGGTTPVLMPIRTYTIPKGSKR